jgi:hypothetical protein
MSQAADHTPKSITRTYDEMLAAALDVLELYARLENRAWLMAHPKAGRALRRLNDTWAPRRITQRGLDAISESQRALLEAAARPEDRKSEWYPDLVSSEDWVESFAARCCGKFSLDSRKVTALDKLNAIRVNPAPFKLYSPKWWIGFAVLAFGTFGAFFPREAFEVLHVSHHSTTYIKGGFALLVLFALLGMLLIPVLTKEARDDARCIKDIQRGVKLLATVFIFCAALCEQPRTRPRL